MCFSATASFTSAAILTCISAVALYGADKTQDWPYAMIPALFGIQQLLEGAIWMDLQGQMPAISCISRASLVKSYMLFSQVFWPLFIPVAIVLMEKVAKRRKQIVVTGLFGFIAGTFLLLEMTTGPVMAQIADKHIAYDFDHHHKWIATLLYMTGTCVCPMLSSHRAVRIFGVVALVSAVLTYVIFATWFISVWCYFAGWMSCAVLIHVYSKKSRQ